MARKGNNIRKRADGRWEGRYVTGRENGRTKFGYVYGKSYKETLTKWSIAYRDWKMGVASEQANSAKLKIISRSWLDEVAHTLKESTVARYCDYLDYHILPNFSDSEMADITNEQLEKFSCELLDKGGSKGQGLSPKTVTEIFRIMNHLRKYALRHGLAVGYSAKCVTIKQQPKPLRILSFDEQRKLKEYFSVNPTGANIGIFLALSTGMRVGEICALKCDDICLKEQKVSVYRTLQRIRNRIRNRNTDRDSRTKIIIGTPKSLCSTRHIPLTGEVCAIIKPFCQAGTYLLTGEADKYMEPRSMHNHFKRVLTECGIEVMNFHTLRHTFATMCIEAGVDIKCLSEILGHSSVNITLNRYVHPTMDMKRANMEKLASLPL